MQYFLLLICMLFSLSNVDAGEAENITACVNKAKEFAGVNLDPFAVKYQGNVVTFSTAQWPEAFCDVKLAEVYNLQVNGEYLVYKGYSGKESYDLAMTLQTKTKDAIKQMRSRIALIEQRANQASNSLRKPNPDYKHLTRYVDDGINRSLGGQAASIDTQ